MNTIKRAIPVLVVSVVVVANQGATAQTTPASPPLYRAQIELTIGAAGESRELYTFGDISGLASDAQGRLFVADAKDNTVRVFSSAGGYVYTIGQFGKGPGDLDSPCCLTVGGDGLLWIKERLNHRYSAFQLGSSRASFVRSVRGATSILWHPDRVDFDSIGRVFDFAIAFSPASKVFRTVRHRLDSSGRSVGVDTLPKPSPDSLGEFAISARGGTSVFSQPFGPRELHAFGAGGEMAHAVSSRYAVLWVTATGQRRALLERPTVSGPRLSSREREQTEKSLNTISRNTGVSRANLPLTNPRQKSPLKALGFDIDGRLWVERSVVDGQPAEADVYDRRGRWIAVAHWPSEVSIQFWTVRGWSGLGVAKDEDGLQTVVRVRFQR